MAPRDPILAKVTNDSLGSGSRGASGKRVRVERTPARDRAETARVHDRRRHEDELFLHDELGDLARWVDGEEPRAVGDEEHVVTRDRSAARHRALALPSSF